MQSPQRKAYHTQSLQVADIEWNRTVLTVIQENEHFQEMGGNYVTLTIDINSSETPWKPRR